MILHGRADALGHRAERVAGVEVLQHLQGLAPQWLGGGELLLRPDGTVTRIRRTETIDDYFITLDFAALESFDATGKGTP